MDETQKFMVLMALLENQNLMLESMCMMIEGALDVKSAEPGTDDEPTLQ